MALEKISKQLSIIAFRYDIFWKFLFISLIAFMRSVSLSSEDNAPFGVIPDQKAFIGKLFYYQINIPENVKNFTLIQAGYETNDGSSSLPDWLYFDSSSGLLFGAPNEKHFYFIQAEAIFNDSKYEDIFVIETVDKSSNMLNDVHKWQNIRQSSHRCRIDLKKNFKNIKQIYDTVVNNIYRSYYSHSDQTFQIEQTLKQWLNQFNIQTVFGNENGDYLNKEYHLYYDVKVCELLDSQNESKFQLDENSQLLLEQLNKLKIDSELIKIAHRSVDEDISFNENGVDSSITINHQSSSTRYHDHYKRDHRRRNAYRDDENIYETPALNKEPWLTTTSIDYSFGHLDRMTALSRTAIPSMLSPTFASIAQSSITDIQPTPTIQLSSINTEHFGMKKIHPQNHALPSYPQLYGTPVLVPEIPLISQSAIGENNFDQNQPFIPFLTTTPTMPISSFSTIESTKQFLDFDAKSSIIVDNDINKMNIPVDDIYANVSTSTTSSTTSRSTTEPTTTILNNRPFVNKRISKLGITAGKFWQFTIPEETFYDKEDGNTRQLRIGFFKDSEILPADYWIQFDNENQYLYALPTEDDIGRHRFNLVAVDLQGGEATETIEIYVRQSRQSLSYTHKFILANITWDNDRYPERIQAVSSVLERMAIQVFEESVSGGLNEAAQRQYTLRHINVLNIIQNSISNDWSIIWTNDSLPRHPCPINEINLLFSRLYDITYPKNELEFMSPSQELRNALSPDFTIKQVKRIFIGRSACGSQIVKIDDTSSRHKEKIVFSNRINRIGPYRLGSAFKFQIPKDTVYSLTRQVDTRQLALSLTSLEPEVDLPEFVYFDTHEQTIYGLPYKPDHIRTYELKLIAEDTVHGGSESDIFILDVEHDDNTREDYLFEITMSFLYRNIELTSRSQQRLSPKDYYEVAHSISTRLMGNTNLEAFRMLDINRYRFTKIAEQMGHQMYDNNMDNYGVNSNSLSIYNENIKQQNKRHTYHYLTNNHNNHNHHKKHGNVLRSIRAINMQSDYFYEFIWTNRTLVTSYSHSQNVLGGGTIFETKTCPKEVIQRDIYERIFPRSVKEFLSSVNVKENITSTDVMDIYNQVFNPLEANLEFLSVEWQPKSVCSNNLGLDTRTFGAKPVRDTSIEEEEEEQAGVDLDDSIAAAETEDPSIMIDVTKEQTELEEYPPNIINLGDRMLAMLIPPIAILIALLFAVTIGCCFHKANQRRKAIETDEPRYHEESPTLYRQRIPIQLEFERGIRVGGLHPGEQESMLDTKFGRHPVQIMPPKLRGSSNLPATTASHLRGSAPNRHANLPYQMLPQQ